MPHFVRIPPPPNDQVPDPKFKTLALHDPSGNAAIAVWGAQPGWAIVAEDNPRFVAERYRVDRLLSYFTLRGLKKGDRICVLDREGGQQTDFLEISYVSNDTRASDNLPTVMSRHSSNLLLNASGLEHGVAKISAAEWSASVEKAIEVLLGNEMGRLIVAALPGPVTIYPWLGSKQQAFSTVKFTPLFFKNDVRPGARADEVLCHELCHRADDRYRGYLDRRPSAPAGPPLPEDDFDYAPAEFFSVTGTNVYASLEHRPLRRDHRDARVMPKKYADLPYGPLTFYGDFDFNFDNLKGRKSRLYSAIQAVRAPWNPFL
jgi:hypothetical protein